jgi:hypothetical protein
MENFNLSTIDAQIATATEIQLQRDEKFFNNLSAWLNKLINENFEQVIALLYRVDVSEKKLKNILATDKSALSGDILARLIIERQLEKLASRKKYKSDPGEDGEAERW